MLNLDYRDARPIYEQVKDGLRRLMVTGVIQEGYVYSVPGKGSFAAPNTGVDEGRKWNLFQSFDQTAGELLFLGVSGEELWARIRALEGGETA